MERKTSVKPTWRKVTQGTLYPFPSKRRVRVKYKEQIQATVEELGNSVKEFELVDPGTGTHKTTKHPMPGFVSPEGELKTQNKPSAQKGILEKEEEQEASPDVEKETYSVEPAGKGWFNVVSGSKKVMNNTKLREADATALKETLEEETPGI